MNLTKEGCKGSSLGNPKLDTTLQFQKQNQEYNGNVLVKKIYSYYNLYIYIYIICIIRIDTVHDYLYICTQGKKLSYISKKN